MPERAATGFFTQYFGHKDGEHHHSEAASGIGGGRQQGGGPTNPADYGIKKERPKSRPVCPEWDFNWDGRMTEATSPEAMATKRGFYRSRELGNVRHIILVRHGQYREDYREDSRRVLTPLGRHQAELTGQRIALMARGGLGMINQEFAGPCHIKAIHVSGMTRAIETAKIIASHLPGVPIMPPDPMLNEALPAGYVVSGLYELAALLSILLEPTAVCCVILLKLTLIHV
jgi:serine/threonine-protein phosphatase PGAM5